jgi:hypothetical protein
MIKAFVKVITFSFVVALMVVGSLNIYSMNRPAFKDITTVVSTQPIGEIPIGLFSVVAKHHWKFIA